MREQEIRGEFVNYAHRGASEYTRLNVRAWGVANEELMRNVYDSKADGMTVNFPDKLTEYIRQRHPANA